MLLLLLMPERCLSKIFFPPSCMLYLLAHDFVPFHSKYRNVMEGHVINTQTSKCDTENAFTLKFSNNFNSLPRSSTTAHEKKNQGARMKIIENRWKLFIRRYLSNNQSNSTKNENLDAFFFFRFNYAWTAGFSPSGLDFSLSLSNALRYHLLAKSSSLPLDNNFA